MFWFVIDVLTLRKLGLGRPFRFLLLAIFLCCLVAGVIYAAVVLKAVNDRSEHPHVQHHSVR